MAETDAPAPDGIDWRMTTAQKVGAGVGLLIGLGSARQVSNPAVVAAFPVAYGVACAAIPRLRGIVAHRRTRWFAAHEVAMAAIAGGWAIEGELPPAAFNGLWLLSAGAWWLTARRPG